jgi:hypothetical protein
MQTEQQELQDFNRLETALSKAQATGKEGGLEGLCAAYLEVKPTIEATLPLIEKIPVYGKTIAKSIRMLISLADLACPV